MLEHQLHHFLQILTVFARYITASTEKGEMMDKYVVFLQDLSSSYCSAGVYYCLSIFIQLPEFYVEHSLFHNPYKIH